MRLSTLYVLLNIRNFLDLNLKKKKKFCTRFYSAEQVYLCDMDHSNNKSSIHNM